MKKSALVTYYSFDPAVTILMCDDEDEAMEMMKKSVAEEARIDREENGWEPKVLIDEEGGYATITNQFIWPDGSIHEDVTTWTVTNDITQTKTKRGAKKA